MCACVWALSDLTRCRVNPRFARATAPQINDDDAKAKTPILNVALVVLSCWAKSCVIENRQLNAHTHMFSHIIRSYYKLTTFHIWSSLSTREHVCCCCCCFVIAAVAAASRLLWASHMGGLMRRKGRVHAGARMRVERVCVCVHNSLVRFNGYKIRALTLFACPCVYALISEFCALRRMRWGGRRDRNNGRAAIRTNTRMCVCVCACTMLVSRNMESMQVSNTRTQVDFVI